MKKYLTFTVPLLIYDDECSVCLRCAKIVQFLLRGKVTIEGHYHSERSRRIKIDIFPNNYDPTEMFWFINKNGAFGARAGLIEIFKEIIKMNIILKHSKVKLRINMEPKEYCNISYNCSSKKDMIKRLLSTLQNSKKFYFE